MRAYIVASAEDGEFLAVDEFNDEAREIVGHAHSVDRDNCRTIAGDRVALGAWGKIQISTSEQRVDVDFAYGPAAFDGAEIHPIPFDISGTEVIPWRIEFESADCELELALSVSYTDDTDEKPSFLWVGIRVNGNLIARSPGGQDTCYRDCGFVVATVPVRAGIQIIEPVFGRPYDSVSRACAFTDRLLSIREIAR